MNKVYLVIGERNSGKTTFLHNIVDSYLKYGKKVLVIDSATEHESKSLIIKLKLKYNCNISKENVESKVVFPNYYIGQYPEDIFLNEDNRLFLFDTSYFLERGYEYQDILCRDKLRVLYKKLSMQIISVMKDKVDVIVLDEIEMIPESKGLLSEILGQGKKVYMSLHKDESILGMEEYFDIHNTSGT